MECNQAPSRWTQCRWLLPLLVFAAGCGKTPATSSSADGSGTAESTENALAEGERITANMLAVYRQTKTYTDHASYVQHAVYRGEGVERELPFFHMSIALARPNRLRLSFQEAVEGSTGRKGFDIASDGIIMRSAAGELEGQIQESAAPLELTTENLLPDPLIREVFHNRQLGDVFPQLAMLLSKDDQTPVFPQDESPRLLDKRSLRGRECYRVATTSPKGTRTFWIDSETYALHRMELPIEAERSVLDSEKQFSQLAIWIDFEDATFDAQVDPKSFEMEVADDARRVRRFVALPPPAPPKELGKEVAEFEFQTIDGEPITLDKLAGKTVLFDFWQVDCAPCKAHTPDLDEIYRELKSSDDFLFYAVNIDGPRVDPTTAEKTLRGWGGSMPVLLDAKQEAYEKLNVEGTPTLMLLDGKGRLQYFHIRQHDDPRRLAEIIRKVVQGGDLAAQARAEHRQLAEDFKAELDAVAINDKVLEVEVSQPEFGERKLPENFAATELWQASADDIQHPGDSLITSPGEAGQEPHFLVLDAGAAIVEFDRQGKQLARHEIPASGDASPPAANGILRTIVDGDAKRWVAASGVGWQQVHLFDPDWKHALAFPRDRHPGIADVQLIQHGEQSEPRLVVGYWGGVGLQGVNLNGNRTWSDRTLDQVIEIAVAPKADNADEIELWCTSTRGTILVLDRHGKPQREIEVGVRSLMHMAVARSGDELECCGLAVEGMGQYDVVGFSPDGQPTWHYKLPRGEFARQVRRIQHVTLPDGNAAWMVAAANGTIFWLDHEGTLIDQFHYGQSLTGLSLTNAGDFGILLVSTPENLTAWRLEGKTAKGAKKRSRTADKRR